MIDHRIRVHETLVLFNTTSGPAVLSKTIHALTGSRLKLTLQVLALDPGATVALEVTNGVSPDLPQQDLYATTQSNTGVVNRTVVDFHRLLGFKVTVANGNATFALGLTALEASSTLLDADGNPFSLTNPIPTESGEAPPAGSAVADEQLDTVAVGTPVDHVYTVPAGKTLEFSGVYGSGSGDSKIAIFYAPDGLTYQLLTQRFNFRPPGLDFILSESERIAIPAGGKVKVTRTNMSLPGRPAFDISTTIVGELF